MRAIASAAVASWAPPGMRVLRALGEGGMGVVCLCERTLHGGVTQRVVLKRPRTADAQSGAPAQRLRERFDDEARCLARVHHANVVRLLDVGEDAQGPWLAIEHVDGLDGHALLQAIDGSAERLTDEETAWIAHEAARGLAAAHALCDAEGEPAPVLHRDLSPQNLLLSRLGEVKVTDFGIAWAVDRSARTTTGVVVGNLRYIAPEQLEGRAVGPATDVYGVGRVLEELLERTEGAALGALRAVASRATLRDIDARLHSMDALCDALLEAVPTLARGRVVLARRVASLTRGRDQVHLALAGLLAAERAPYSAPPPEPAPTTAPRRATSDDVVVRAGEPPRATPVATPAPRSSSQRVVVVAGVVAIASIAAGAWAKRRVPTPVVTPVVLVPDVSSRPSASPEAADAASQRVEGPDAALDDVYVATVSDAPSVRVVPRHNGERPVPRPPPPDAAAIVAEAPATLRVSALPRADITVNDGPRVGTPHVYALAAGTYLVRARMETDAGVLELRADVTLRAGETRLVSFTPERVTQR